MKSGTSQNAEGGSMNLVSGSSQGSFGGDVLIASGSGGATKTGGNITLLAGAKNIPGIFDKHGGGKEYTQEIGLGFHKVSISISLSQHGS